MVIDQVLPNGYRVAATRQRLGKQLPNGSHALALGAGPGPRASANSVETCGVVTAFGGQIRGRPPRPRSEMPAAFK